MQFINITFGLLSFVIDLIQMLLNSIKEINYLILKKIDNTLLETCTLIDHSGSLVVRVDTVGRGSNPSRVIPDLKFASLVTASSGYRH